MVKKDAGTQINLPGIDPRAYAYEALKKENPVPSDFESADRFFRAKTDALLKLRSDHDLLRVVLKGTNVAEEKEKHEYTAELSLTSRAAWEQAYIGLAVRVHHMWLDQEAPKQ